MVKRIYAVSYTLGYRDFTPHRHGGVMPDAESRRREVKKIEDEIKQTITKHGGHVESIFDDDDGLGDMEGDSFIHAEFPNEESAIAATQVIEEAWGIYGVSAAKSG